MKKKTAVWLTVAAALILIGCGLTCSVMFLLRWDLSKLSTVRYETNAYTFTETVRHVSVNTVGADVVLIPSENDAVTVTCREQARLTHSAAICDGTLTVEVEDTRKWYDKINIMGVSPCITVALPAETYNSLAINTTTGDVTIPADISWTHTDITATTGDVHCESSATGAVNIGVRTGDITLSGITAGSLMLTSSTGDITVNSLRCVGAIGIDARTCDVTLTDMTCQTLAASTTTGDITMSDVIAANTFALTCRTGDIKFNRCDAAQITAVTSTGDITGSLLSDKLFLAQSDTGHVEVPKSVTGGTCEMMADTGNIYIKIAE